MTPYRTPEQPAWDFPFPPPLTDEAWDEIKASHSWWTTNVAPLPGASRAAWGALRKWSKRHDRPLMICTSRCGRDVHDQTQEWLGENFGDDVARLPIIVTAKASNKLDIVKGVGADTIIDDAPHTLRRMAARNLRVFAPRYQYNEGIAGVQYVRDFNQFVEEMIRGE